MSVRVFAWTICDSMCGDDEANPQADLAVGQAYLARELLGRLKLLGRLLGRLNGCSGDCLGDSTEQCVCLQEVQSKRLEVVARS